MNLDVYNPSREYADPAAPLNVGNMVDCTASDLGRQLERETTMRVMTAYVSHELNHPLGTIINLVNVLSRNLGRPVVRPAEIYDYLNVIKAEANRATTIIKQLRLLTERRPQTKYGFCLVEACRDCITRLAALAETKQVRVRLRVSTPQTYVTGVKELLEIALYNLLINSVTALDNPTIAYRRLTVRILAKPPENTVIQVFDNGCGLPDEIRDRIFEPFVTGRPEGSGIGLAIAGDIVRWHRGQLNCLSRKHGTCMEIILPLE